MEKLILTTIIKNNFRSRKGLISVIKTYKTRGSVEALSEILLLTLERLKVNPGKFFISRQAIYLYKESKHLTRLEKMLINRNTNNHNNFRKSRLQKEKLLQVEEI